MIITFFDSKGIMHKEFVPTGQTVNSMFYREVLRRLRENERRYRSQLWWEKTWLLHHNDDPSHTSVLTHQFLAKNKIAVIPPPNVLPWFGTMWLLSISKTEIEAERTPVWGDPGLIAESAWHSDGKGLTAGVPKMEKTVGKVSTCGRKLLRGWRRPTCLMVNCMISTASVRKILDQPMHFKIIIFFLMPERFRVEKNVLHLKQNWDDWHAFYCSEVSSIFRGNLFSRQ